MITFFFHLFLFLTLLFLNTDNSAGAAAEICGSIFDVSFACFILSGSSSGSSLDDCMHFLVAALFTTIAAGLFINTNGPGYLQKESSGHVKNCCHDSKWHGMS